VVKRRAGSVRTQCSLFGIEIDTCERCGGAPRIIAGYGCYRPVVLKGTPNHGRSVESGRNWSEDAACCASLGD
jgi:hypothetical protein